MSVSHEMLVSKFVEPVRRFWVATGCFFAKHFLFVLGTVYVHPVAKSTGSVFLEKADLFTANSRAGNIILF